MADVSDSFSSCFKSLFCYMGNSVLEIRFFFGVKGVRTINKEGLRTGKIIKELDIFQVM